MKDFVTHEQALALKELGFDEPCFAYYDNQRKELDTISSDVCERLCKYDTHIKAPAYSQAFRFFREESNMSHEIFKNEKAMIDYVASKGETHLPKYRFGYTDDSYHIIGTCMEYEEAETKCLDKLIEVVKSRTV